MENDSFFRYVLLMAGVTYGIRMLPLVVIRGRIHSRFWQSFLYYVPYAVLGAMTFPAIFSSTGNVGGALCGLVAGLVLGWKEKGLLTVAVAACVCAYIGNLIF